MECTKASSQEDIKKKYKDLAKKYHPDRKGGDAKKVPICSDLINVVPIVIISLLNPQ